MTRLGNNQEIVAFVAGIDETVAGPEPVIALLTDNAEDVLRVI